MKRICLIPLNKANQLNIYCWVGFFSVLKEALLFRTAKIRIIFQTTKPQSNYFRMGIKKNAHPHG